MRPIRKKIILDLREAIIKGEYPPGAHLVENDLCARFKASRTPVREALAQLEKEGFVCMVPGSGAHVTKLSIEDVSHIYDILIVLEGAASRLACNQISEKQLGKLEEYNFHFEKSLKDYNADLLFELNDRFHWLITSETGNTYLIDMRSNFRALVNRISRIFLYVPGQMEATIAEHRQIIAALRTRNPSLAEFVMREHLENAKKQLLAYLCNRQAGNLAGDRGVKETV
jgi:DNA-binding GntR family transcriptional regulator